MQQMDTGDGGRHTLSDWRWCRKPYRLAGSAAGSDVSGGEREETCACHIVNKTVQGVTVFYFLAIVYAYSGWLVGLSFPPLAY